MTPVARDRPSADPPLKGIRVVELGWAAAGPLVGTYLASHGADVIHLESSTALDPFRSTYPPFKDNVPGPDRAAMFAFYNADKRGVTLDLKQPAAIELALRLVATADVVIESFPAGTLARRGLGVDVLHQAKSDLVILTSCNQGQTGPHAQHPGYGSQLTALAGFTQLLGDPARTPVILYGPYIDYIAVGYGVVAILAALERRARTGQGCVIDLSQYEAGLQFMAPALLEYDANGTIPTRAANRDRVAVPHGVYPASEPDSWIALSVWDDSEWARLREALGDPEWARDPSLAHATGRRSREAWIDERISEWSSRQPRASAVMRLRSRGLRAAPVETIGELFVDPQLGERRMWRAGRHPVIGDIRLMAPPFLLSDSEQGPTQPGPLLAQHTEDVFRGIVGLDAAEYAALEAQGVFK